jgi:hypothetical protein
MPSGGLSNPDRVELLNKVKEFKEAYLEDLKQLNPGRLGQAKVAKDKLVIDGAIKALQGNPNYQTAFTKLIKFSKVKRQYQPLWDAFQLLGKAGCS